MFPETGTGASRAPGQHPEGAAGSCVTGLSPLRPRLHTLHVFAQMQPFFSAKLSAQGGPGAAGALQTAVELQPQGRRESTDRRTHGQKDSRSLPAPQAPSADASPDPPARSGSCPPGCPPEPHAPSTRSEGGAAAAWCPVSQLSCPPWQSLRCPWHLPGTLCPSQARLFREESSTLSPLPPRPEQRESARRDPSAQAQGFQDPVIPPSSHASPEEDATVPPVPDGDTETRSQRARRQGAPWLPISFPSGPSPRVAFHACTPPPCCPTASSPRPPGPRRPLGTKHFPGSSPARRVPGQGPQGPLKR